MSDNVYDIESGRTLEALVKDLGSIAECKRLGFVFEDDKGVMSPSIAGLGYLLYVKAAEITTPVEAFAAGYQCAKEDG
jgi:hypothetical protein